MVSIFIYTCIACFIFYFLFRKKLNSSSIVGYSVFELAVFFLLMRVCPLLMLEESSQMNCIAFAADIVLFAAAVFVSGKLCGADSRKTAAALCLFSPLPVMSIVCGDAAYIPEVLISISTVLALVCFIKKRACNVPLRIFLDEYIMYTAGIALVLFDKECRSVSIKDMTAADRFPVFIVLGLLAVVLSFVFTVKKLMSVHSCTSAEKTHSEGSFTEKSGPLVREGFGRKNCLHMIIITVIYAVVVFFRLGSFEAPQSLMKLSDKVNSEIVLDLGEYISISKLDFFLGCKSNAKIALSAYNEVTGEWMLIDTDVTLKTVFCWNEVPLSWNLRYIGIVFTEPGEYEIREIVVSDKDGNVLVPINSSRYPELFDEQEKYPKYATYYYRMMFDEIYHGRTAYEFHNDLPIYENTHPPLGKTLISLGIAAFGMTPFGWRFIPAVFGTLMVPVMYLFVWKISRRSDIAFIGTTLLCTEFMHFTLSRIATIDIIAALFILLMFFFMYFFAEEALSGGGFAKQSVLLLLCGISTALAVSTKWTGVYAVAGIAVIFFVSAAEYCSSNGGIGKNAPYLIKLFGVCVVSFILIPAAVYCLSYLQFSEVYIDKNFIGHAISNSVSMFNYHYGVNSPHPYESEWYEWLIDRRPVLDAATAVAENNAISTVSTFGNPLILFCGLASFLHNFWLWRCKGCKKARFLVIAYLSMLMPWLFIHRTVFIYQYFGCIMIIILMICNSLNNLKNAKKAGIILICSSLVIFVMFFPVISGIEADRIYIQRFLEWLPTWVFE